MSDLNEKFFLKKKYFNLFLEYFTEEQYAEYQRAVISYILYNECVIKTPEVYEAFMFTKHDIDKENRIIMRNQENAKNKAGRKKSVTAMELIKAIQNGNITTYEGLESHFGVCRETIKRRMQEIDDVEVRKQIYRVLNGK